ncbi:MAG: thioesterase family protein [Bacteroidota bacterium]|nr:thioesterase family protein [Bacteroidota bacterium]
MVVSETKIQVLYADTDQMGYVYYGNFAKYYEHARTELLKKLGFSYKELESRGYGMPLLSLNINYRKPAYYDDTLTIKAILREKPTRKITFDYETYNQAGQLLNTATTELILTRLDNRKPTLPPYWYNEIFSKHFEK